EKEKLESVQERAEAHVQERLLDLLVERPEPPAHRSSNPLAAMFGSTPSEDDEDEAAESESYRTRVQQAERLRERMKQKLEAGELEETEVEIEVEEAKQGQARIFGPVGMEEMGFDMQGMLGNLFP